MKFAHLADNHLGYRQYNLQEREKDFYDNFAEVIDKIIEERVDFVVHSGDLFEFPKPPIKALLTVLEGLGRLKDRGIEVYAIPGNHDISMRKDALPPQFLFRDLIKVIGRHKNPFYIHEGIFIGGVPYCSRFYANALRERLEELSGKAENYRKRILVLHQGIDKYLPFDGSYELKIGELPPNFDYYALGHVHRRIIRDYHQGKLVYPGSTEIWRMDEHEDYKSRGKGFYVVDLGGDEPDIQPVNLERIRPFIEDSFNVSELDEHIQLIKDNIRELEKRPILYLSIAGKSYDISTIHNKISSAFRDVILYLKPRYTTETETADISVSGEFDISDLIRESLRKEAPERVSFSVDLFHRLSSDRVDEAKQMVNEFYGEFK